MNWWRLGFLTLGVSFVACSPGKHANPHPLVKGGVPPQAAAIYEDHTISRVASEAELNAYSLTRAGLRELKFIITDFSDHEARAVRFMDARFYQYHDEWYWFRLLNGQPAPGDEQTPFFGRTFSSPAEATAWGKEQLKLPIQLSLVEDGRLYSPRFYQLALEVPEPSYGLGSLFQLSGAEQGPAWAFELEYGDEVDVERLSRYFSLLKESILPKMASGLVFIARSPSQYALVERLRAERHPLALFSRLSSELAEPGAVQVYQPGLTAGVLRIVESSELESFESKDSEILLLPLVPDYLPAAAGIVTSVPQTPLSHVNLLARNRGIPNVYLGRAAENRHFHQLARAEMPVVMMAEGQRLVIEALDARVYELWKRLTLPPWRQAPAVAIESLPYTRRLRGADFDHVSSLRPVIGGKAAGTLALLSAGVDVPPSPIAISVRSYFEHLKPMMPLVEAMLADPEFLKSPRVRFLALEGSDRFEKHYTAVSDKTFAAEFIKSRNKHDDPLLELLRLGGLTGWIRSRQIEPATLRAIDSELRKNFAPSVAREGLRFRSSSTIEDIEGFSGAGLYESHTGFLDAARRVTQGERKKTVEDAILRTWASYWGWEAFEERERARVDHLSGGMAILVHPRFEDGMEMANGVLTLTVNRRSAPSPSGSGLPPIYQMELNVQRGAESVTNPHSGVTPEIVLLLGDGPGEVTQRVLARASGSSEGATVLSSEQMENLFREAIAIAETWLRQENRQLPTGQRRKAVTLDFEFRLMAANWARAESVSPGAPAQMILKQVRSLEPALVTASPELEAAPIPRELLGRAVRVEEMICSGRASELTALRLWTDPLASPDFGFSRRPFVASLKLRTNQENSPQLGWWGRQRGPFEHDRLVDRGFSTGVADEQTLRLRVEESEGVTSATVSLERGEMVLQAANQPDYREAMSCHKRVLLDDPDRLLREELGKIRTELQPVAK